MNEENLIVEYEALRRRECELIEQLNVVDARLIEIEGQLPDEYTFPGDRPLQTSRQTSS